MRMPAMNGMKFLKEIKNVSRSIRTTLLIVSDLDETNRKSHHSIIYQFVTNNGKNLVGFAGTDKARITI